MLSKTVGIIVDTKGRTTRERFVSTTDKTGPGLMLKQISPAPSTTDAGFADLMSEILTPSGQVFIQQFLLVVG